MIMKGNNVISEDSHTIYASVQKSITIQKAPASVVVYAYNGLYTVRLPKACDSAGRFVFVRTEIATATNYANVTAASGDRILSGATAVTSITLNDYGEETLLFSDGLFWYTC